MTRVIPRIGINCAKISQRVSEDRVHETHRLVSATGPRLNSGLIHGSVGGHLVEKHKLIERYAQDFPDICLKFLLRTLEAPPDDRIQAVAPPKNTIHELGGQAAILRRNALLVKTVRQSVFGKPTSATLFKTSRAISRAGAARTERVDGLVMEP